MWVCLIDRCTRIIHLCRAPYKHFCPSEWIDCMRQNSALRNATESIAIVDTNSWKGSKKRSNTIQNQIIKVLYWDRYTQYENISQLFSSYDILYGAADHTQSQYTAQTHVCSCVSPHNIYTHTHGNQAKKRVHYTGLWWYWLVIAKQQHKSLSSPPTLANAQVTIQTDTRYKHWLKWKAEPGLGIG